MWVWKWVCSLWWFGKGDAATRRTGKKLFLGKRKFSIPLWDICLHRLAQHQLGVPHLSRHRRWRLSSKLCRTQKESKTYMSFLAVVRKITFIKTALIWEILHLDRGVFLQRTRWNKYIQAFIKFMVHFSHCSVSIKQKGQKRQTRTNSNRTTLWGYCKCHTK